MYLDYQIGRVVVRASVIYEFTDSVRLAIPSELAHIARFKEFLGGTFLELLPSYSYSYFDGSARYLLLSYCAFKPLILISSGLLVATMR